MWFGLWVALPFHHLFFFFQTTYVNSQYARTEELQVGERGLDPVVLPPSISSIILSSSPKYLRELTTLTHEGAASR
jgi:hypothetical protein